MTKISDILPESELQRRLDRAEPGSTVFLPEGIFREKLLVTVPGLTIRGAGQDRTRIVWDDYAEKEDARGEKYNTFRTWTMAVCADGVTLRDLTVENDALYPEAKGQEVALSVCADRFFMENCRLRSTQDTLFLGPLPEDLIRRYADFLPEPLRRGGACRQEIRKSLVEGNVDFIFGCGDALLEECEIRSLPDARGTGFCAAPAHALTQTEGFTFLRCRFTHTEGVRPESVFLARPWRDHGICRLEECTYGEHIRPSGFDKWRDTDRDKTARFYEEPPQAGRVSWVRRERQFTLS